MSSITCGEFRAQLERELRGHPGGSGLSVLAWHEHLLGCEECRALLEAEEALEALLASLPEPRLPEHLAVRVLARLRSYRSSRDGTDLDRLLDLDRAPEAPANLGARVLAGLSEARRAHQKPDPLDALLDMVPAPEAPEGLAGRVLVALELPRRPVPRFRLLRRRSLRTLAAAAMIVVLGIVAWRALLGSGAGPDEPNPPTDVDEELIAHLDVLERLPLLEDDDLDLMLLSVDPLDETLIEAELIGTAEDEGTEEG